MRREVIFFALLCYNIGAFAKSVGETQTDDLDSESKAEGEPPRPLFSLPSLPSLNLPQIQIPNLQQVQQALNLPNVFGPAEVIRATKTEYVTVRKFINLIIF